MGRRDAGHRDLSSSIVKARGRVSQGHELAHAGEMPQEKLVLTRFHGAFARWDGRFAFR